MPQPPHSQTPPAQTSPDGVSSSKKPRSTVGSNGNQSTATRSSTSPSIVGRKADRRTIKNMSTVTPSNAAPSFTTPSATTLSSTTSCTTTPSSETPSKSNDDRILDGGAGDFEENLYDRLKRRSEKLPVDYKLYVDDEEHQEGGR
ncbi:MAG: hypothetical protein Q9181_004144 [Wetmoreana brouardii]